MISTVVFDAVGTLLFADPPAVTVYETAAASVGWQGTAALVAHRLPIAVRQRFGGQPSIADQSSWATESITGLDQTHPFPDSSIDHYQSWNHIVADVFPELDNSATNQIFERLWIHFARPQAWRLFDDVPVALDWCRQQNLRCAIASNFDSRLQQVVAGHSQLAGIPTYTSGELGAGKPHSQFFNAVSAGLNEASSRLLMIGDESVADYQGARQAGWSSILLKRSTQFQVRFEQISGLDRLPAWFQQFGSINTRTVAE